MCPVDFGRLPWAQRVAGGVDLSETGDAEARSFFLPADHGEETQPLRIIPASKKPIIKDDLLMTKCMMNNK